MRVGWLFIVLILAMLVGKEVAWAQPSRRDDRKTDLTNPGAAWFDCLHSNAKRVAGRRKPSEADAQAAIPKCKAEEDAVRNLFEQAKSKSAGAASRDPYARISSDDMIAEFRRRFIWEINHPLSPKR
jgi:hypothetical protein